MIVRGVKEILDRFEGLSYSMVSTMVMMMKMMLVMNDDIGLDVHFTKQATGRCVKGVEKILDRFEGLPPIIILVIICRAPSVGFVASVLECYRNVVTIELWGGIKADAMLSSGQIMEVENK